MLDLIGANKSIIDPAKKVRHAKDRIKALVGIGMQSIIEDYVHSEGRKVAALMLNLFFCVLVGLTCAFAVLKLSFGA